MAFNNFVDFGIAFAGILTFCGVFGGLCFLGFSVEFLIRMYKYNKSGRKHKCETCIAYKACSAAFGGHVPEDGCAYYKFYEEVEISAK